MGKTFVLSDESLNCYGFRVLTSGIELEDFKKNPVMLWSHTRSWSDDERTILPIGRWENLRVENGKLLGEPVFDTEDKFAAKIGKKVDNGFINACSIGIEVLERSEAKEDIVAGQTRPTIKRCRLQEVSITDIPANGNCVSLYNMDGKIIELKAESIDIALGTININKNNKKEESMKLIALKIGLSENATEAEVLAKLQDYTELQSKLTEREHEIASLKSAAAEVEKRTIEKMVNEAILSKKLTADQKNHFIGIGEKMGVEALQTTLSSMNSAVKPTDVILGAKVSGEKKWADLSAAEREILRQEDLEKYQVLFEGEYGFKPFKDLKI